jgi:hypothetical protein
MVRVVQIGGLSGDLTTMTTIQTGKSSIHDSPKTTGHEQTAAKPRCGGLTIIRRGSTSGWRDATLD